MLKRLFLILSTIYSVGLFAQDYMPADYQSVLIEANTDSTFVFDKSAWHNGIKKWNKLEVIYLGTVTTRRGSTFKIMTSLWIWGLGQRGTSRILVYNGLNQYVGNYNMGMPYDLPTKMVDGVLYFDYSSDYCDCDKKLHPHISFKKGLPTKFFLPCNGNMGDFYTFY